MDRHSHITVLRLFLLVIGSFTVPYPVPGQSYPFTTLTTADGLAQSAVSCIFQDSRGRVWFGTWGGISMYDAKELRSYRNSAVRVTCIAEGSGDTLWVGTTAGLALVVYRGGALHWQGPSDNGLPSPYVITMLKDASGAVWVGTNKGLVVFAPSGERFLFDATTGLQDDHITGLWQEPDGAVLIGSAGGILRCRLSESRLVETHALRDNGVVGSMTLLRGGDVLAALVDERRVVRWHEGAWLTLFSSDVLGPDVQVRSLGEDAQGNIWIGTTLGLAVLVDGHAHRITGTQDLPNRYIGAILRDREDVLWFGTEAGVLKLPSLLFRNYGHATGLKGDHVIAVYEDEQRNIWLGTYSGATQLAPDGRVTSFGLAEGLPHLAVHSFIEAQRGTVWIGTWEGLVAVDHGVLVPSPVPELRHRAVIRMLRDQSGTIWCGSRGRIVRVTPAGKVLLSLDARDGIPDAGICALHMDGDGTIWFGTDEQGCGFYRDGRVVMIGAQAGLPDPWVMSIGRDQRGGIWFGTQRGVVEWNGTHCVPIRADDEDLRSGIVTFVVCDSLGLVWFGTQRGVYAWNGSALIHLDSRDGLIADPTRCGSAGREGDLWIGTIGGVSRLDMKTFVREQRPPIVSIQGVTPEGDVLSRDRTAFSFTENTLTVEFNALSFRDERRTEFQWMLAGIDEGWQPPHTDRHVRYTHLPWGQYEFRVRARNPRTPWSDPARFPILVGRPFWATWWFLAIAVTACTGILLLLYTRRVHMLEQESETERRFSRTLLEFQEAERTRIAGELHDSLAQTLAIAKNKALLGIRSAHDPLYAGREFAEISATLSAAMEEVRGIAHNLRPYQLDRLGVTRAILSLAGTVNASTPLRITAEIENVDRLFTPEMGTMVYRIIQEAVNNVLTHSGAGDASIAVRRSAQDVVITIRDSGRGFKLDRRAGLDAAGFGLSGIARRARLLGGTAAVESSPGAGTSVCVTIPLPVISQEV